MAARNDEQRYEVVACYSCWGSVRSGFLSEHCRTCGNWGFLMKPISNTRKESNNATV